MKSSATPRRGTAVAWAAGLSFLAGLGFLWRGLSDDDASSIALAALWFAIATVWLVRVWRQQKSRNQTLPE